MIGKCVGAVLLAVGCFLYGYYLSVEIKKRREELQYVGQLLTILRSEITYKRASLKESCIQMAKQAKPPYAEALLAINDEMEKNKRTFEEAWKLMQNRLIAGTWLKDDDLHCIDEIALFGEVWDIELLVSLLDRCMQELTEQINHLEKEYEKKGRTYLYLGGCTGIGLVILLI